MGRDSNGNTTGPTTIRLVGYRHMPGDDDAGSVSPGTPLSPHSDIAKKDRGGGTDNNNETTAGKTGTMAPGSPYARKAQGDGGSNDAGDNNHVDKGGALANGSALTRKDQGDGGGADTRGGGGSSTIAGTAKVVNPGGGPKQISSTTATKAN
jgi:hypothetical protein